MKKIKLFSVLALLSVLFLSSCGSYDLKLDKEVYAPGETIKVDFTADKNWETNAWIGIIPSDIAHGSEGENDMHDLSYQFIQNKASGTMEFVAPFEPGKYDIRMHDADNESTGIEVAYVSFEVKE